MSRIPEQIPGPEPTSILDARQREIWEALSQKTPELAHLYLGGIKILNDRENPARISFAAHAAREIMNHLPAYFDVPKPERTEDSHCLDEITRIWEVQKAAHNLRPLDLERAGIPLDISTVKLTIAGEGFAKIDSIITKRSQSRNTFRDRAAELFSKADPSGKTEWKKSMEPVTDQWVKVHRRIMRPVHAHNPGATPPDEAEFRETWRILEDTLSSLLLGFWEPMGDLDALLRETNPTAD